MGKFLKYEDSNFRTFVIDPTNITITRPKRLITREDLLGAIFETRKAGATEPQAQYIVVHVENVPTGYKFTINANAPTIAGKYDYNEDSFTITVSNGSETVENTTYTNIFVDEFGREERYV